MIEITSEMLAKLKQDCINVADGYDADPDDVMALIAEVERLRQWKADNQQAIISATAGLMMTGAVPKDAVSLGDAVKAVSAEVERLRATAVAHKHTIAEIERLQAELTRLTTLNPIGTLHEDRGVVLLWFFFADGNCMGPPAIGSIFDEWFDPHDYTHWSPIPNPQHGLPKPPDVTS